MIGLPENEPATSLSRNGGGNDAHKPNQTPNFQSQEGLAAAVEEVVAEFEQSPSPMWRDGTQTTGLRMALRHLRSIVRDPQPPTPMEDGSGLAASHDYPLVDFAKAIERLELLQKSISDVTNRQEDADLAFAVSLLKLAANQSSPTPIEQGGEQPTGTIFDLDVYRERLEKIATGYRVDSPIHQVYTTIAADLQPLIDNCMKQYCPNGANNA
jgi:hypothetical protein